MAHASFSILLYVTVVLSSTVQRYEYDKFYFVKPLISLTRKAGDGCNTCYGYDCYDMNIARCNFYSATSELLYGVENENDIQMETSMSDMRSQVDMLMMNLVEQASAVPVFKQCIPLISEYTDCTKENICIGCKRCFCDEDGLWNCSTVQNCRQEPPVNVDHRVLIAVMETLTDNDKSLRRKRWIYSSENPVPKSNKVSYEEISEWMYGAKPLVNNIAEVVQTTENAKTNMATVNSTNYQISDTTLNQTKLKTDSDYLAFDEVLSNVFVESKTYNRRRPLYNSNVTSFDRDYMSIDNVNVKFDTFNDLKTVDPFMDVLNAIEYQSSVEVNTEANTEVVIDLLKAARDKIEMGVTATSFKSNDFKQNGFNNLNENTNDFIDFNIMKRDVSEVNKPYNNNSTTTGSTIITIPLTSTTQSNNDTNLNELLKSAMLIELNNIIDSKENELKGLLYVKGKILDYLKGNYSHTKKVNVSDAPVMGAINNAYFSFYNIEINPKPSIEYRRSNTNKTKQYLERLKRDILVVARDITAIQKLMGMHNLSPGLRTLMRAMRHYIHHTENISPNSKIPKKINPRRHWINPYPINKDLVRKYLLDIINIIDKDMPESNALASLSPKSKEILKRIIRKCNFLENSINHSQISSNDFISDLNDIGLKWKSMTLDIVNSQPANKLHHIKLLQFVLLSDISKIKDAIAKVNSIHNRRLITVNDEVSERELKRINDGLKLIHTKINRILHLRQRVPKKVPKVINKYDNLSKSKKDTLLKHIRDLLKNSKKDIIHLLRKKVPKAEIVKELAKKKLNELTKAKMMKYRNVMRKWQNNFNISRKKRAALNFEDIKNKIKNILPKYLRGKVHSGIKNSTKHKKHRTSKGKSRGQKNKGIMSTRMTTMKIITTTQAHEPENSKR
ncbi:hypothetical protein evm_001849 [Chilo suppressalis]|nr:hypothetical protein evm_001849 [Chilo suppressalis]